MALSEIDHVGGLHEIVPVGASGSVDAQGIPEPGEYVGLVENAPGVDVVAEILHEQVGVVGEVSGGVAIGPAALVFERLRQVPVIHGDQRADVVLVQLIEDTLVVVEALGIGGAGAIGLNARPTDGEAIAGQVQLFRKCYVFLVTVVGVAGDVASGRALDLADRVSIAVPHRLAFAVGFPCAFDLIGGGGRAPHETLGELIWLGRNAGSEGQIVGLKPRILLEGKGSALEIYFGKQSGGKTASGHTKEFSAIHEDS